MKCFALTGGIASGKSTVSQMFQKEKIPVIDADVLAREVVEKGTQGLKQIISHFGTDYLNDDGTLNRKKLAEFIFNNPNQKEILESILHPLIASKFQDQLKHYEEDKTPFVIYEAPLIFEKNLQSFFDATLLVSVDPSIQTERLMKRDGLNEQQAKLRLNAQMPLSQKIPLATHVIHNEGTVSETAHQLQKAWFDLTGQKISFVL